MSTSDSTTVISRTNSYRQQYIRDLFPKVQHLRYAFLKYLYASLDDIPEHSDIDLLVEKNELSFWLECLRESALVKKLYVQTTSFASYVELYFVDDSFLSIDLIHQCKWRQYTFMKANEVLDQSLLNEDGIKVALPEHLIEYVMLFFTLNDSAIPDTYQQYFLSLNKIIQASTKKYLMQKYDIVLSAKGDFAELRKERLHLQHSLQKMPENRGFGGLRNQYFYYRDVFRRRQPTITFTGVDGAGKSTMLYEFKQLLTEKYRREVVIIRQRPSILPILSSFKYGKKGAEERAANTLPRQGTNKSKVSSLLRFLWYYSDYVVGQWYVEWKYNRRGRVLLYDRYYYDYIVDSRRANISLSPKWIKALFALVFKPELNVLLYAKPEVILARKQELSGEVIEDLTRKMLGLFEDCSQRYRDSTFLPIENIELSESLHTIESAYIDLYR